MAELDVLSSFADLSSSSPAPYVRPLITSSVGCQMMPFPLHVDC